jgi:oxygen-independent coproporphyrinogen-3 oxidase
MEANPDDLHEDYLKDLIRLGFNRISIGVQSFHEEDLTLIRRSHSSAQAFQSIESAARSGFSNITIDLMYGIPGLSIEKWAQNLDQALRLPIQHLSAYHLTFEQGTVFDHWRKKGRITPITEEKSVGQYSLLREKTRQAGFEHYEISNFARDSLYSRHNLIYWKRNNYLGMGPSAHSFNGKERRWNSSSLKHYIEKSENKEDFFTHEYLTLTEHYHDYIITSLRTKWGVNKDHISHTFGESIRKHFERTSARYIQGGHMVQEGNDIWLTAEGWFISDHIMGEFFMDE